MPQNVAAAFSCQVEIGVLRKIDRGRLVTGGFVIHNQLVFIGQRIPDLNLKVAGKTFLAVLTQIAERNANSLCVLELFGFPDNFVETRPVRHAGYSAHHFWAACTSHRRE